MTWVWRQKWRLCGLVLLAGLVAGNFLAWRHARALFRFQPDAAERTKSPEDLGFGEKIGVLLNGVTLPKPQNTQTPENLGLAFQTVNFPAENGQNLESWLVRGNGETAVLLFHGYAASKQATLPMARILLGLGCNCLLVDFRGSGGSGGATTSFGYHEAEDVRAAERWTTENLAPSRTVLYGISMGGAAVTRACAELGVKPDGLAIESTFPSFRGTVAKRFELMGLPALVMTGRRDTRVPLEDVRVMAANFANLTELHVFEAGHRPFAETHPGQWAEAMRGFLEDL